MGLSNEGRGDTHSWQQEASRPVEGKSPEATDQENSFDPSFKDWITLGNRMRGIEHISDLHPRMHFRISWRA